MDRFSSLPNEIICHIGSFLSAKEAVFTMVLSKRWRNLFTIIPKLHFDGSVNDGKSFNDFVEGVLALPASSRVKSFSLNWGCEDIDSAQCDLLNRCLSHVLKRGVLVLKLQIKVKQGYSLPFEVFTCKTVAKLKLGSGFTIDILPKDALLPALKTLFLDSIRFFDFGRCAFKTLLYASPVLEELVIYGVDWEHWKWSRIVSSPTLQRLSIRRKEWNRYEDDSDYENLDPRAKLNLAVDEDCLWNNHHADDFNPMNLINGFQNVEIMDLTVETMEMLYVFDEAIPVFENLFHVSVSLSNHCWFGLPVLLKKSPHLKTLVIENRLHYESYPEYRSYQIKESELVCQCVSEYSFLLSCHVEVLKINKYEGTIEELEEMKHFLEKLSCLELVKVHAQATGDKKVQVMADLLMLPRASSKCKIQVKFFGDPIIFYFF